MRGKAMAEITLKRPVSRARLSKRTRDVLQALLGHALLIAVGLFFFIPFLWMLSTALKSEQDVFRVPPTWLPHDNLRVVVNGKALPVYDVKLSDGSVRRLALVSMAEGKGTFVDPAAPAQTVEARLRDATAVLVVSLRWQNFIDAMERSTRPGVNVNFFTYARNSLIVAFFCIVGTLVSCAPAAYGFARIRWPGRDALFMLVLATMMLPFQVTMIPLYVIFTTWLHWGNTFLPLIVPTFFGNGFDIFLLRQFFRTIPEELCDAARVDGASEGRIFLSIVLPLSVPVLTTISVLTFLWAWNDFLGPLLYLTNPQTFTMALGLQDFQGRHEVAWNLLMAASVVFTLPIIVAFFFAQRTFIQGVKLTGLKE
jgi:multiple sugar transport system permease protein